MQIAPQTVVVTLLQHQIADELENFSVTGPTVAVKTEDSQVCRCRGPTHLTTRHTASNAARHSTGHLTVDSMVDSPRGNPRHTAHAKLLTDFAHRRDRIHNINKRPDHPSTRRPPATANVIETSLRYFWTIDID